MKKYNIRLNEDRLPMLVLEESFRYKDSRDTANSPQKVLDFLRGKEDIENLMEEHVYILATDIKIKTIGYFELSIGGSDYSVVDKKAFFRRLLAIGADGFIVIHNHPSGDSTPSAHDYITSDSLKKAAKLLDIRYHDFIISGSPSYYSFRENNLI